MNTLQNLATAGSHLLPLKVPLERRKERRYPTEDPVVVKLLAPAHEIFPGTVIDVSRSGLRIECAHLVPQFSKLEVIFSITGQVACGQVRYCRHAGYLFQAGVSVEDIVATGDYSASHLEAHEVALFV